MLQPPFFSRLQATKGRPPHFQWLAVLLFAFSVVFLLVNLLRQFFAEKSPL